MQNNLHRFDLNLLRTLDALLTERNVTRAARRMSVSQPAMSTQLARLREAFEDPLFLPQARGVLPTARALELAQPVKQLLGEVEQILQAGARFDPARSTDVFRIASTGALHFTLCVPLVARLRTLAPRVRISLFQLTQATISRQLEQGDIDLVFTTAVSLQDAWRTRRVLREQFVTVLRRDHPALTRPLDLDLFCELEHLLISPGGATNFRGAVDDALAALGRRRRVAMTVQNFLVAPYILEATDLVATMPARLARSFPPTLAVFAPPVNVEGFSIFSAWHPRSQNDAAHAWLREQIEEVGRELGSEAVSSEPEAPRP
jgi:DNA-binding transcriptional LysR family regulator